MVGRHRANGPQLFEIPTSGKAHFVFHDLQRVLPGFRPNLPAHLLHHASERDPGSAHFDDSASHRHLVRVDVTTCALQKENHRFAVPLLADELGHCAGEIRRIARDMIQDHRMRRIVRQDRDGLAAQVIHANHGYDRILRRGPHSGHVDTERASRAVLTIVADVACAFAHTDPHRRQTAARRFNPGNDAA